MRNVVIVAGCRTPIGTIGGQFKTITSLDLSIPVMQALVERAGIDPAMIEDVIWGCNYQRTYKENNLARVAAVNASGMNDAASGVILMEEEKAKELGLNIICRIKSVATVGVPPELMGIDPIDASRKALDKAGMTIDDIDLFEINEAFAAQCLACQKTLGIPDDKLNVNGSGISLGHPVGATGSRLVITCMYELMKRGQKYGLATLCAGGGMGTAVIIEMV